MGFENLESFDETKHIREPDAGPEGIQRKVRRLFGLMGSSRPDLEALDDDTRKEVQKMLKCPRWNGDYTPMILWGILRPKPHLRYRTGSETAQRICNGRGAKNLSFKHEFLQNPLLEYI